MEAATRELISAAEMREAQTGFLRVLRKKGFGYRFIEENAEDLMGKALVEYAAWIDSGRHAYSPAGWLITAAWRRTQELLDYQSRRPQSVSIESVAELTDSPSRTPEQVAIEHDRGELLRQAMNDLPPKDRQLLTMTDLEGFTKSEAAEALGWSPATATRHHRSAMAELRSHLTGKLEELPALEVGLAAWIAENTRQGWSLRIAGVLEPAKEWVLAVLGRPAETWRQVSSASDPANATMLGGLARGAGYCAVAALTCAAGFLAGPKVHSAATSTGRAPVQTIEVAIPEQELKVAIPEANPTAGRNPTTGGSVLPAPRTETTLGGRHRTAEEHVQARPRSRPSQAPPASPAQTAAEFGLEGSSGSPSAESTSSPTTPDSSAQSAPSGVAARAATPSASSTSSGSGSSGNAAAPEFGL